VSVNERFPLEGVRASPVGVLPLRGIAYVVRVSPAGRILVWIAENKRE
jgi:hypothetical protein